MVEIQSHNIILKLCYHTLYVWATECFYTCMLCYSISSLKNLEVLNISHSNLSEDLLDNIFTSLLSLRELYMKYCKLSTLPNRCVLYYSVQNDTVIYIISHNQLIIASYIYHLISNSVVPTD